VVAAPVGLTVGPDRPGEPAPGDPPGSPVEPAGPDRRHVVAPSVRAGGAVARTARALAAGGTLCVLAGIGLLASGPVPRVAEIGALSVPATNGLPGRVASGAVPFAPADVPEGRLLALGAFRVETRTPEPAVQAGTAPVELALPGRDVRAPVVAVTTGPTGALIVPEPPSTVGWWSPSALAGGAGGTTVLAGHVDSAVGGLGALAVLRDVAAGEELVLRGADGREIGYRVTARRQYAKAELPPEVFAAGGPARLVLITCGGAFDHSTRHYADNVVVFAEPT
jgi:hypothetical protein